MLLPCSTPPYGYEQSIQPTILEKKSVRMALKCAVYIGKKANPSLLSARSQLFNASRSSFPKTHLAGLLLVHPSFGTSRAGFGYSIRAVSGTTSEPITTPKNDSEKGDPRNWKIKMLYDGDCPLCMREVDMLRERNQQYRSIKFVDISSDNYSPEENQGLDYKTAMGRIHAILSDGTIVTDVEAFRRLYEAVGLGWVHAITKYEPIATIANAVYGLWAKYRMQITGRPPLEEVFEAKMTNKRDVCGDNDSCKL